MERDGRGRQACTIAKINLQPTKKQGNWIKRNFPLNSCRLWILLLYLSGLLGDQIDHIVEEEEEWDDDITLVAVKVV